MRLRRLNLARYGKFTDQMIDFGERVEGEPDLHIIYGPNEAGKSTALNAFLDLLFGIELQSRYGFLHPYSTMRVGGCLELSVGLRELVRIKRPQPTLRDTHNEPVAENLILGDLGGLDRNSYRTMFSLDDDTLEAGGKSILASNGELGQLLFSASAGLSELSKTLMNVRLEADGFNKPNSRSGELQQLKAELVTLKQERDEIDTLASEYNRLAATRNVATSQYEAALVEQAETKAGLVAVQRLLAALPRMAALNELHQRLKLLAGLPEAPPGWAKELPALQLGENRHHSESELAKAEVKRLSEELEAIVVDERALQLVGHLDRLTELRARYLTSDLDLPTRRRELASASGVVGGILTRLGRSSEPEPSRLLLNAAQSAALNSLIESRSGVQARVTAANDELSQALNELTEARSALQEASAPTSDRPLVPLKLALNDLRKSNHVIRRREAARRETETAELMATQLAALTPWQGTMEALAGLAVPEEATVEAWAEESRRIDALIELRSNEVERTETETERRAAELDAIGKTAGILSDQEAAEIRGAREAAWAKHRRVLDPVTADAFEAILRRDDIVSGARLGHERDLAKLHETTTTLAIQRAEAGRARKLLDEAIAQRQGLAADLSRAAAEIGPEISTVSPSWLQSWIVRRGRALDAGNVFRQIKLEIRETETEAGVLRDRLTGALRQAAIAFDPHMSMDVLAAAGEAAIEQEAHAIALSKAIAGCEREVRKRELAVQSASTADRNWLAGWRAACSACWLGANAADLPFEAVREMLTAAGDLGRTLRIMTDLADRIRAMEEDRAAFERELEKLTRELGLERGQHSGLDLAQVVADRVYGSSQAAEEKRRLQGLLTDAVDKQRKVEGEALIHACRVGEMMEFMQAGSLIELAGRLRDAEEKADLERQVAQAERDIPAALHMGSLAEAQALLEDKAASELQFEEAKLASKLENLEHRTRELFASSRQAADRIAAVGGDGAAARIEERRRTTLLVIEDKARTYLRLRIGISVAERALRAYRDQHRSSMMQRASNAFKTISRGAYRGLGTQPDKEGDILVALGADGGSKLAVDLSKGTRFQLYLALRAAGYEEFAKVRPLVPFIADDIIETFDDFRAEETLRVFEEMARLGQVIYLTHHDHLRVMAERIVPGVRIHRLAE